MIILAAVVSMPLAAQKQNAAYLTYIENWKEVAVQQQAEYGIPASITMAQALLESGAGQSELATQANNHFGIKCSNGWFGGVYYHDDETKGECFRQYFDAAESFSDHSLFLMRPRYASCFEIAVEDYEGWAHRIYQCGYATDKLYPHKLIKLIEDYRLDTLGVGVPPGHYDPDAAYKMTEHQAVAHPKQPETVAKAETQQATQQAAPQQEQKRPLKATVVHGTEPIMVIHNDPEPPYVVPKSAREERDSFFLDHPKLRCNGLTYVEARKGDTYSNVAFRLNVRERDLREDNDALGRDLEPGDRIYLMPKKMFGPAEKAVLWVHPGESLWKISQREGVQLESIQRLNELDPSIRVFRSRQKIYLRKVKD